MAPLPAPSPKTRIGCGFLIVSAFLTCVLLAINGLIVMNVVHAVLPTLPEEWRSPRIAQTIVFLGPLVLLFLEWWVCDVSLDWLRPYRRAATHRAVTHVRRASEG
jgi:hypothetical protein